ncbi:hypothetical protein [Methyloversatilis sp.]|uniref:hypothetical protein n=2 Tax=Methyloversatilis sp. TaxID=2569862 RepID=UPI0027347CC0|nr:hypothetical protein [Methyloversatilis sp.]MDP2870554.1 hypothetical protein [Methyloversatilis sp.]MDP3290268.1 hypothetical protein [Methyloversatilis sp.]MDP3457589.1 hypothetical protein [Methyloversatilis sp.]MDP3578405.1 hypothetical protein [Methyloversatilis sp.]
MIEIDSVLHMLKTIFNVDSGLSEAAAINIYRRSAQSSGKLEALLEELGYALSDPSVSWKALLANSDYEVFDAETEEQAKAYARRVLWEPLQGLK